jgi:hypothetical protein
MVLECTDNIIPSNEVGWGTILRIEDDDRRALAKHRVPPSQVCREVAGIVSVVTRIEVKYFQEYIQVVRVGEYVDCYLLVNSARSPVNTIFT